MKNEQPAPTVSQQIILVAFMAVFILLAMVLQRAMGLEGILWATIFGACGGGLGGLGGLVGGLVGQRVASDSTKTPKR